MDDDFLWNRPPGNDWQSWQQPFQEMVSGLPGRLYTVLESNQDNSSWPEHFGDSEFLEAWLSHPHYHLVK